MHSITLEQFDGPLDLLLQLIQDEKLDITQVSLATVADQYLAYIHRQPKWDPDELADFLVVAAKLLLLKSKTLIPSLDLGEDEESARALEQQLKLLKRYRDASNIVHDLLAQHRIAFARDTLPKSLLPAVFVPPSNLMLARLPEFFHAVLERLKVYLPHPTAVLAKVVSLEQTIRSIRDRLMVRLSTSFQDLIGKATSKTDVIVHFLAILELVKQRLVLVDQRALFTDIQIQKNDTVAELPSH